MTSKQHRTSDLISDLIFMAQTTCATMFVSAVLVFLDQMIKKEERKTTHLLELLGFAATKNPQQS